MKRSKMSLYGLTRLSNDDLAEIIWIMGLTQQHSKTTRLTGIISTFRHHRLFDSDEEAVISNKIFLNEFLHRCLEEEEEEEENFENALITTLILVYGHEMTTLITSKQTNLFDDLFALRPNCSSVIGKYSNHFKSIDLGKE